MERQIWRFVIRPATASNQAPAKLGVTLLFPTEDLIRPTELPAFSRHLDS